MKILVLRVINSSRHRKCFVRGYMLVPRSFGFLTQTTRAYNPVRRTFYIYSTSYPLSMAFIFSVLRILMAAQI